MSSQHAIDLWERIGALSKTLDGINAVCNDAFSATATSLEEEEFLNGIHQRDLYRRYKLEYVDTFASLVDEIKGDLTFGQLMENYFFLAAEYALMGEPDRMIVFVKKIDWKSWNITQSKNPVILQAYRELSARAQELQSLKAH